MTKCIPRLKRIDKTVDYTKIRSDTRVRSAIMHRYRRFTKILGVGAYERPKNRMFSDFLLFFMIPVLYVAFKLMASLIELLISVSTISNQGEVLEATQMQAAAANTQAAIDGSLKRLNDTNGVGQSVGDDFGVSFNNSASEALASATEDAKNNLLKFLGADIIALYATRTCVRPQVSGTLGEAVNIKYFPSPITTQPADEGAPCLNYIELIFLGIAISILLLSVYVLFRY